MTRKRPPATPTARLAASARAWREAITLDACLRGAFLVMALAACAFSAVAALRVWTEGAEGPISAGLLSAAAIVAEAIVVCGLPVIAAAWAAGDKRRAIGAACLFLIALPMSFSTALAFQAQIQRQAEARAMEAGRARTAAEADADAARRALAQFDAEAAALAGQFREDLARTPASAVSARARLIEAVSAANNAAAEGRRPLAQAVRDAEARVAALPPATSGETARARELAALLGVTPEQAERGFHIAVALLLELVKTLGAFIAARPQAPTPRPVKARASVKEALAPAPAPKPAPAKPEPAPNAAEAPAPQPPPRPVAGETLVSLRDRRARMLQGRPTGAT